MSSPGSLNQLASGGLDLIMNKIKFGLIVHNLKTRRYFTNSQGAL
jgi:hypothetical protein